MDPKKFKNYNRSLNISLFKLKLPNGETHLRKCLMFSEHTDNVFIVLFVNYLRSQIIQVVLILVLTTGKILQKS